MSKQSDLPSLEELKKAIDAIYAIRQVGNELCRIEAVLGNSLFELEHFINTLIQLRKGGE